MKTSRTIITPLVVMFVLAYRPSLFEVRDFMSTSHDQFIHQGHRLCFGTLFIRAVEDADHVCICLFET